MRAGSQRDPLVARILEETPEDLFERAPCGYLSALLDGTIVRVNQTFLDWTGYQREEINGVKRVQDLLTPGGRIYFETHYSPLLRMQGHVNEIAVDIIRADGTQLPALINSVEKKDSNGRPVLVRTTVFDATDRREYERELLRAIKRAEESEAKAKKLARTLQASLIPPAPPEIKDLDVAAVYRPAGDGLEVGGDFYDVFELAEGDWAVVLGDVEGKGAEAASVTALARYTIRAAAMRSRRPEVVLSMLNEALLRQQVERFCTIVFSRVRIHRDGIVWVSTSSGGHPMPVAITLKGLGSGTGAPGDLLGVFEHPQLRETTLELSPGDALIFFTDGITEGRRGTTFFGEDRLREWLNEHCRREAQELAEGLVEEVVAFQEGDPRDDMAVVVVRCPLRDQKEATKLR